MPVKDTKTSPAYELIQRLVKDGPVEGWQPELRVVGEGEAGGVVVEGGVDTQVMGLVGPLPQRAVHPLGHVVQDASVGVLRKDFNNSLKKILPTHLIFHTNLTLEIKNDFRTHVPKE